MIGLAAKEAVSVIEAENAPPAAGIQGRFVEGESWARAEYDRCHPDDSFDDLKRRAQFSIEDKGLLREWLEAAERRGDGR